MEMEKSAEAVKTEAPIGTASRFDYVKYDEGAQHASDVMKSWYSQLALVIESIPPGRAQSLALTKLEESYMWVGKAIRDDQIKRNGSAPLMEERKDR